MGRDVGGTHFDAVAEEYDRTRPVLPAEVFDDLMAIASLKPGDRVLEIGCGTGQATVPLARRGLTVTALEPGRRMAEIARANTVGLDVVVEATDFESWRPADTPFDAVVAINSLHWVDAELRYAKPASLLRKDGFMAVGGFVWTAPRDREPFWREIDEDWQEAGAPVHPLAPPEAFGTWRFPVEGSALFDEVEARRYVFDWSFSTDAYLDAMVTMTSVQELDVEVRRKLLARIRRRLDENHGGAVRATFVGLLTVGRRAQSSKSALRNDLRFFLEPPRESS